MTHGLDLAQRLPPGITGGGTEGMAMEIDDDLPRPKPVRLAKLPLDLLGVAELEDYIAELRAEIARVEADIGRKRSHRSAADAFFKKG
jgi:uncharacterized small protein (DUF1192 family)